jgi:isopentenyl diphosphate isomerase/L-lactate dehydrogenase-like FMN-dependent dehydrogenase
MHLSTSLLLSAAVLPLTHAARPFLEEPDTGHVPTFAGITTQDNNSLPSLSSIWGLYDFQYVAEQYLNTTAYTYYRNGAAGEFSYRNNLEAFHRIRLRPRVMLNINNIASTLNTSILGYNFSVPFFIGPAARAGFGHPDGELALTRAAAAENILYIPSDLSTRSKADIQSARAEGQVMFQQLYLDPLNTTETRRQITEAEELGFQALVLTVDSPANNVRHRAWRYDVGSADSAFTSLTWDQWRELQDSTPLPIIPKGIQTWEDAVIACRYGVPAIYLSNHGGRSVDGAPSPIEIALEIYENAPWVFQDTEVWADGGVRYGTDVLKLLALGVKAVGLSRPFMFANVYGEEGVQHAVDLMRREVTFDAANIGVGDLSQINSSFIDVKGYPNGWDMRR